MLIWKPINTSSELLCMFRALDGREYLMIIFLISLEIICCEPSSERSRRDGSDEGSHHTFL